MSESVPHNQHRLGHLLGYIFHPLVVFIPALLVVLNGIPLDLLIQCLGFIVFMILCPTLFFLYRFKRQGKFLYQRENRHVLYGVFGISILICFAVAIWQDAPSRLMFSLLCLLIWAPIQFVVNLYFTKLSGHTAVITGIAAAFLVMGELDTALLKFVAFAVIVVTGWARIVTGNHTLEQVVLGIIVSISAVLISAALLGWL